MYGSTAVSVYIMYRVYEPILYACTLLPTWR